MKDLKIDLCNTNLDEEEIIKKMFKKGSRYT